MFEPRCIAARAAAEFMARQLGEEVGATVRYRIRLEAKVLAATRVDVVTEGISHAAGPQATRNGGK